MSSATTQLQTRAFGGSTVNCIQRGHVGSSVFLSREWKTCALRCRSEAKMRSSVESRSRSMELVALLGFGTKSAVTGTTNYICIDCGYIYPGADFSKEPNSYICPACKAPKRRFKKYKGYDVRGRPNNSNNACLKRLKEKKW